MIKVTIEADRTESISVNNSDQLTFVLDPTWRSADVTGIKLRIYVVI